MAKRKPGSGKSTPAGKHQTNGGKRRKAAKFGFEAMRDLIRDTLRPVFQLAIAREAGNDLYAFMLRTDDSGTIITAACNSEQNLREKFGLKDGEDPPPPDDDLEFPLWCDARWRDEEWGRELIEYSEGTFRLDEAYEEFQNANQEEHFGGVSYAAMIIAMQELDQERLFGSTTERDGITLYCHNSDGCAWLPVESAKVLNSPRIAKRFSKEWSLAVGGKPAKPSGPQYDSFGRWIGKT